MTSVIHPFRAYKSNPLCTLLMLKSRPMKKRIVFMGSPEFAVPCLEALARHFDIAGVVTQPDRPAGRGRSLTPPPVKTLALDLGLPVMQPVRIRQSEAMQQLQDWAPDVIVVAAFGQILRQDVLGMPAHGCINVHASCYHAGAEQPPSRLPYYMATGKPGSVLCAWMLASIPVRSTASKPWKSDPMTQLPA